MHIHPFMLPNEACALCPIRMSHKEGTTTSSFFPVTAACGSDWKTGKSFTFPCIWIPAFFSPSCISDLRLLCLSHWKYFYAEKNKRERLKRKTVSVKVSRLKLWGADEILALQPERKAALAKHSALSTKRDPKVELRCCPLWPWALRQRRDE